MNPLAGNLFASRAIGVALLAFTRAGGGARGWEAARDQLARHFPAAQAQSIEAVIRASQDANLVGQRYRRAGPDYTPPREILPDVRRAERSAGVPSAGVQGNRPEGRYYHDVIIEVIDARWPGKPAQRYRHTEVADEQLTRSQLETIGQQIGNDLSRALAGSNPQEFKPENLFVQTRIVGSYIGY